MLGGVVVDVASYTVREILLRDKTARVVVRILVAPAVAELFHRLRMAGIAQVHRHGTGALFFDIACGGADRPDHGVALRRGGDVDGRLRHGNLRFRQPDILHRMRRRGRHHEGHGVSQTDVLCRVNDHAPGNVASILPRGEHAHQPVHGGVRI